jgi:serine protein kinase
VAPHADWTLALWAVLTRLKKPNSINFPPSLSGIVSALSPIEKARLYDTGEMPVALGAEDRKLLRSSIRRLRDEYKTIPYYEGRMGASAREMKTILYGAAQNGEFQCVSPLAVLRELEEFVKRVSEYEFLKQDVKDGYHDAVDFIATVRNEYLNRIDREVRESMGLYDSRQWEDFLRKYVSHVSLVLKKEKVKNPITGRLEEPDHSLIDEFEKIVEAPQGAAEKDAFRQNIISTVGAWSLDHAGEPVVYARVFPEYWQRLEKHYFDGQRTLLTNMHNAVRLYGTDDPSVTEEGSRLAQKTIANMAENQGYCEHCAREVIGFLMRSRY